MDGIPYVTLLQSTDDEPPPPDDEELHLHDLQESDTGWYSCRVTNQYGGVVRSGWVEVTQEVVGEEIRCPSNNLLFVSIFFLATSGHW